MSRPAGKLNAFFYKHRNKGIPNLMLWIAIINVAVYLTYRLNPENPLFYSLLCFRWSQIVQGEVWRVLTYPFVYLTARAFDGSFVNLLFGVIGLTFYFFCGKVAESVYGRLKFNLFYLSGILLIAVAGLLIGALSRSMLFLVYDHLLVTSQYLNLTLVMLLAMVQPEAMARVYFVIPVKMKWLAWIDLGYLIYIGVRSAIVYGFSLCVWMLPLVALLNFALFFFKDLPALLPDFLRHPKNRVQRQTAQRFRAATQSSGPVRPVQPYRFRCTVCGRTDVSDPKLEFRYCSKCAGYRCYCMEHINNHAHIME